jgi:hypothetical protein
VADEKTPPPPDYLLRADEVANAGDVDIMLVNAGMYDPLARNFIALCRKRRRRPNVILILVTTGGDAGQAYWIARSLQQLYTTVSVFVSGHCKSAGTLVAMGANQLIVSDTGEIGPLDVQMSKPDEFLQRQSGLTATDALRTLHEQAYQAFEHFLYSIIRANGHSISTRTATHIAVQLTNGLFAPVYEHVDPIHVGEAGRALLVAQQYGELLDKHSHNLKEGALQRLTTLFASHDFVIDRSQIKELFHRVREPLAAEQAIVDAVPGNMASLPRPHRPDQAPVMAYLNSELPSVEKPHAAAQDSATATAPTTAVNGTNGREQGNGNPGGDAPAVESPGTVAKRPPRARRARNGEAPRA